ncbi:MAG: hypothetical protein ABI402_04185 [Ferruginibacter sp.]
MKWFLFFILLISTLSCKDNKQKKQYVEYDSSLINLKEEDIYKPGKEIPVEKEVENSETEDTFPQSTVDDTGHYRDSGYFTGNVSRMVDYKKYTDTSMMGMFLSKNLDKKNILYLNKYSLSHTVFIDKKKKIRLDTLRNEDVTIISKYKFGDNKSQVILINGVVARTCKKKPNGDGDDILNLEESSFRRFLFKGKEFYYITAYIMDCVGNSACLPNIYFLFDVKNKKLSEFFTFRVNDAYFFGDVNGDDKLDYLEIVNDGGYGLYEDRLNHYKINLYSCNASGKFEQLKDPGNKEYFIEGNSGTDYYVGERMYIDKYYWPVKLK